MLQLMGLQRVRHNLATEQQKSTKKEAKKKKNTMEKRCAGKTGHLHVKE